MIFASNQWSATDKSVTILISELLTNGAVAVDLKGNDKHEIIREMVGLLDGADAVVDLDDVLRAVEQRESIMTTAVGEGLAIPHAKTDGVVKTVAAFATTANPIEFGALDDKPVELVFLLVGPESDNSRHVRMLSRASLLFCKTGLREAMIDASTPEGLLSLIEDAEGGLDTG